jgi:argininosuccinate lyase
MLARARAGQTTATALADRLVADQGVSFREAHRLVGSMLGGGATAGPDTAGISLDDLDPVAVAAAARYGAGPGAAVSLDGPMRRRTAWAAQRAGRARRWRRAAAALEAAVARLESGAPDGTGRQGELLTRH